MSIPLPLSKAYFEITNVCNASCTFCPGHHRSPRFVTESEFVTVLARLQGAVEYLYFHVMGEPLCHPQVRSFAALAKERGFRVMITSNGLLSDKVGIPLIEDGNIYKLSLSLHSYEANAFGMPLEKYLDDCLTLAAFASERHTICALRLWNREEGSSDVNGRNERILSHLRYRFGDNWSENRTGYRIRPYLFLEWGERFTWPGERLPKDCPVFCHALRSQIGILSDGTVVPCCLDGEGRISLGNLFSDELSTVLSSPRAVAMYEGFTSHHAVEPLCRTCGFAERFLR